MIPTVRYHSGANEMSSIEVLDNMIAKRLTASAPFGISAAAADAASKQRLVGFSRNLSRHPDTCAILNRAGLAERAIDLAAAGGRFSLSEVDQALDKMPLLQGSSGDRGDIQSKTAFKIGLQQLGLL